MSHVFGNKSPFLPLCFSIPSQFHLCAPRFSLLIKSNNPKRGKKQRGKSFHTSSLCAGTATSWRRMQPVFESTVTDRPTDWLTGESASLRGRTFALSPPAPPRLLPPTRSIQLGNPLGVSDTLSLTLSTLAGNNFGRIIPPPPVVYCWIPTFIFLFIF